MKRNQVPLLILAGALALFVATSSANAAPPSDDPAGQTATVESAGKDGGLPVHTAQVESADAPEPLDAMAQKALPVPLIAVFGVAAASVLAFSLWRRQRAPHAG